MTLIMINLTEGHGILGGCQTSSWYVSLWPMKLTDLPLDRRLHKTNDDSTVFKRKYCQRTRITLTTLVQGHGMATRRGAVQRM